MRILNQNSNTSWLYQLWLIKQKATDMLFEPAIATAAFGGLTGFLVGYFIRKIVNVVLFALGGVLSLIIYLQYQGLITVNVVMT
jgi:uncharacterized membrane protein (Fun14 family)